MNAADRSLIAAMAAELADVRLGFDEVAGLVTDLVRRLPIEARPQALTEAQAIDGLTQRLDALAGLLRVLAGDECVHAAAAALPLADMVERLTAGRAAASSPAGSGELILFD